MTKLPPQSIYSGSLLWVRAKVKSYCKTAENKTGQKREKREAKEPQP
jgi:hypothetical protein